MNPVLPVSIAQTVPTPDAAENLAAIREAVEVAGAMGSRLVVLPEESMLLASDVSGDLTEIVAETWPRFLSALSELAARHGLWIIAGGYEPSASRRPYNSLAVVDDRGNLATIYRKLHLYDAFSYRESDYVTPGSELPPVVMIDGVAIGLLNCYDIRFPELARHLVDRGADALSVSAAWVAGPRKEDHWVTLVRARAIENTCWLLAAGSASADCVGTSMLVDPFGVERGTLPPTGAGVLTGVVSLEVTALVRESLPALANRRLHCTAAVITGESVDHLRKPVTVPEE